MRKCRLQKTISFMLSFIMVLSICVATVPKTAKAAGEVQFTVSADKQELKRGDQVTVTVSMSGNTEGYGLTYDLYGNQDKLKIVGSPKRGDIFNGLDPDNDLSSCRATSNSSAQALVARTTGIVSNGSVMTVTFQVLENASLGDIDLTSEVVVSSEDANELPHNCTDNTKMSVVNPATGITLDKTALELAKGQTAKLTAALTPADASSKITWKSDNDSIAVVSEDGTVTAKAGGKATITATAGAVSASCTVNVGVPMTGISVSDVTVSRGKTAQLAVTYEPSDTTSDKSVTWKSGDESVAKVDPATGVVTGLKEGTAVITATTTKTSPVHTATAKVTVKEKHLTEELGKELAFRKLDALKGQTVYMNGFLNLDKLVEENGITDTFEIVWSSSDTEIAAVDKSGAITFKKEGKVTITAVITAIDGSGKAAGEYTVVTDIEVREIPLKSIAFDQVITEMAVGSTKTLKIIYNPADTTDVRDVVWESSDSSILSVEDGKITALKVGEAEITAKVGEKSVSCKIVVKEAGTVTNPDQNKNDNNKVNDNKAKDNKANANSGVRTGDTANVALYVVLLLVSLAAVLFCYRRRVHGVRR